MFEKLVAKVKEPNIVKALSTAVGAVVGLVIAAVVMGSAEEEEDGPPFDIDDEKTE